MKLATFTLGDNGKPLPDKLSENQLITAQQDIILKKKLKYYRDEEIKPDMIRLNLKTIR